MSLLHSIHSFIHCFTGVAYASLRYIRFDLGQTFVTNAFSEIEEGITETFTLGLVGFGWTVKQQLLNTEAAIMQNFSTNVVLDKAHFKSISKPQVSVRVMHCPILFCFTILKSSR